MPSMASGFDVAVKGLRSSIASKLIATVPNVFTLALLQDIAMIMIGDHTVETSCQRISNIWRTFADRASKLRLRSTSEYGASCQAPWERGGAIATCARRSQPAQERERLDSGPETVRGAAGTPSPLRSQTGTRSALRCLRSRSPAASNGGSSLLS